MNMDEEGPIGGKHIHMLWMLLFLKEYSNGDMLAGMCSVCRKTIQHWVDEFIDHALKIDLVSTNLCLISAFVCQLLLANNLLCLADSF